MFITQQQIEILDNDLEGIFSYASQADRMLSVMFYASLKKDFEACETFEDLLRIGNKLDTIDWEG